MTTKDIKVNDIDIVVADAEQNPTTIEWIKSKGKPTLIIGILQGISWGIISRF